MAAPNFTAMMLTANGGEASRSLGDRMSEDANILDYFKVPETNYDNALTRAIATGKIVLFPYNGGTAYDLSSSFTLSTPGLKIRGKYGNARIRKTGTSSRLFTITAADVRIENLEIDASLSGLSSNRVIQFSTGAAYSEVRNVYLLSPKQGFGFDAGAHHCKLVDWYVESSAGHAVLVTDATTHSNVITRGETEGNVGFGIILTTGTFKNEVSFNRTEDNGIELIGVTYDCWGNRIIGNHAEGCHDNGISVTGFQNVVVGNTCRMNYHAGIYSYGRENTITGNVCANNNQRRTIDGTAAFSGIMVQCSWGGLGRDNTISGNTCVDDQAVPTQTYGIEFALFSYPDWTAGQTILSSYPYRKNGLKLYKGVSFGSSAVTGATPPTHTSGTVSDGVINWLFVNEVTDILDTTRNEAQGNNFSGNRLGDVNDASTGVNNYQGRDFLKRAGVTLRFDHTSDPSNNVTSVFHPIMHSPTVGRPLPEDAAWQWHINEDNLKAEYSDGTAWYLYSGAPIGDSIPIDYNYGLDIYTEFGLGVTYASRHTFSRTGVGTLRGVYPLTTLTDFSSNIVRRDARGAFVQTAATNLYPTSTTPVTETISLDAGTYSLDIVGSGSATLSGGPTGIATDLAPVVFTLGSTTSVTVTLAGTVTHVNLIAVPASTAASGALYCTQPIKNVTTSTIRNTEDLTVNLTSLGLTKGTVVVIAKSARFKRSAGTYLSIGSSSGNRYDLRNTTAANNLVLTGVAGSVGATTFCTIAPPPADDTRFCAAFTFDGTDVYGSLNGSAAAHGTLDVNPGAPTTMHVGSQFFGANPCDGAVERVIVLGTVVSPTKLADLSKLSTWA